MKHCVLAVLPVIALCRFALAEAPRTEYLSGQARTALLKALDGIRDRYDPDAQMMPIGSVPERDYTRLGGRKAHPTRDSLECAARLLEANEPAYRELSCTMIAKVISLQDTHPSSRTYGVWPWYLEEPLGKMVMPDLNWAAFLGKTLLYIWIHHRDQLPPDLREQVRVSILRACESIRRRPLHPGYTNIASMNSYVAIVAGEQLNEPNVLSHGRAFFDQWYDYTMFHGSFTEFNSPTYTRVAIGVVSRMLADFRDPERKAKARQINDMLWAHLARRFHEPTWQWAGPYSRAYHYVERAGFAEQITRVFAGKVQLVPSDTLGPDVWDWRHPECPPVSLARYFAPLTSPREEVEVFFRQDHILPNSLGLTGGRKSVIPVVGTTYLHPKFALGSANFSGFWEQQVGLIAHWGDHQRPAYMAMRLLNERHGFCSGALACVQDKGDALVAVLFLTDFGDEFIDLDRLPNQKLTTNHLRIEFELGGLSSPPEPGARSLDAPLEISDRGTHVSVKYLGGTFAGQPPRMEITRERRSTALTLHLYEGPQKAFHLPTLNPAFCLFAVRVTDESHRCEPTAPTVCYPNENRFAIDWKTPASLMKLSAPTVALPFLEMEQGLHMSLDGKPPWSKATPLPGAPAR